MKVIGLCFEPLLESWVDGRDGSDSATTVGKFVVEYVLLL